MDRVGIAVGLDFACEFVHESIIVLPHQRFLENDGELLQIDLASRDQLWNMFVVLPLGQKVGGFDNELGKVANCRIHDSRNAFTLNDSDQNWFV